MYNFAILDNPGNMVVKYICGSWVKHAIIAENGEDITKGIGIINPIRYRGYYYDTETGLNYHQSRYYDPEIGRFISQDSIEYAHPDVINGLNLYAYCNNNPVMNIDPEGTWSWKGFWNVIAAVALGASTAVVAGITAGAER